MSTVAPASLMTAEEMLALPQNGVGRELIAGHPRERAVTSRNRGHSRATIRLGSLLEWWPERQPEPRAEVVGGEAGFRLRRNPDTTVGVDVAYVSADVVSNSPASFPYIEGPPVLAVEILSPPDEQEAIAEKVQIYLDSDVALVWLVDPRFRTVIVHRLGVEPELLNVRQEISAEPHLPGFRIPVARIFSI